MHDPPSTMASRPTPQNSREERLAAFNAKIERKIKLLTDAPAGSLTQHCKDYFIKRLPNSAVGIVQNNNSSRPYRLVSKCVASSHPITQSLNNDDYIYTYWSWTYLSLFGSQEFPLQFVRANPSLFGSRLRRLTFERGTDANRGHWKIKLTRDHRGRVTAFGRGWTNFVNDNHLKEDDVLFFFLLGGTRFRVCINKRPNWSHYRWSEHSVSIIDTVV